MRKPHKTKRRRSNRRFSRRTKPGTAPGFLQPDPNAPPSAITVMAYNADTLHEERCDDPGELPRLLGEWPVVWINVDGLGDERVLRRLGESFGLHRLALEDVVHTHQRPKAEQYDANLFIVLRMLRSTDVADSEQISMFLGENFVLTFQEKPGDCFEPVRERIRHGRGRIRKAGADYLAYALTDAVIDHYFPALEHIANRLESLEQAVLDHPDSRVIEQVYAIKKELPALRRAVWAKRETVNLLIRDATSFFSEDTRAYLRDCYDHTVQLLDILDSQREVASGLAELYMSGVGQRMNEIMKVLTMMATLFIPLSFIAGLYGMNFDPDLSPYSMPELRWYLGYPFVLTLMAAVVLGQLVFFKRKGWLGSSRANR